eukprot:m51a1_g4217 hypothetical protein (252) ;mRNA; f:84285-85130
MAELSGLALERVLFFVAALEPLEHWSSYASVCRSWREAARRAFRAAYSEAVPHFTPELAHDSLVVSNRGRTVSQPPHGPSPQRFCWAAASPSRELQLPPGSRASVSLRLDSASAAGEFVGVFVARRPPQRLRVAGDPQLDALSTGEYALRALATTGGGVAEQDGGGEAVFWYAAGEKRLDAGPGSTFCVDVDLCAGAVSFRVQKSSQSHEHLVASATVPCAALCAPDSTGARARLYFVVTLCPGSSWTIVN